MTAQGRGTEAGDRDHICFRGGTFLAPVTGKEVHHYYGPTPTATAGLPPTPAAFTSREVYLSQVLDALDPHVDRTPDTAPIVAVGGLGGMGKTALALQTAHTSRPRFPGGTLFIGMRGYDEIPTAPEQAVLTLLRSLGIRDGELPSKADELYAWYRSQLATREPVLIVLDNASDPGQVAPLLPGDARHRVLVTSRRASTRCRPCRSTLSPCVRTKR